MSKMRWDLLNALIEGRGYSSYLEIGTRRRENFDRISCPWKTDVDPAPWGPVSFKMTSDAFFAENRAKFDLIFIDGLHLEEQVMRDIENALAALNSGGAIVVHDCNPANEINQQEDPEKSRAAWNGTVWRAWVRLRATRPGLSMCVVDIDHGCGVIECGSQTCLNLPPTFDFAGLAANRREWLNLKTWEQYHNA